MAQSKLILNMQT